MRRSDDRPDPWSPFAMRPAFRLLIATLAVGFCGLMVYDYIGSTRRPVPTAQPQEALPLVREALQQRDAEFVPTAQPIALVVEPALVTDPGKFDHSPGGAGNAGIETHALIEFFDATAGRILISNHVENIHWSYTMHFESEKIVAATYSLQSDTGDRACSMERGLRGTITASSLDPTDREIHLDYELQTIRFVDVPEPDERPEDRDVEVSTDRGSVLIRPVTVPRPDPRKQETGRPR